MQHSEEMTVAFLTTAARLTVSWRIGKCLVCRSLAYGSLNHTYYFGDLVTLCSFLIARQVNGKTRLGVFALQAIQVGDPLTYNYRYMRKTQSAFCPI
jgi:hypothetical protein